MRTGGQLEWILASKIHQNLLLDGSWAVLWPSWAVLGRLGGLLRRLEEASKNDAEKMCTKSRQKSASSSVLGTSKTKLCYLPDFVVAGSQLRRARGKPTYQDGESLTKETLHRKTAYRE